MMVIDNKFNISDTVYIKTDPDQKPRMITGIFVVSTGHNYRTDAVGDDKYFYEFQLSYEKNHILTTTS